MIRRTMFVTFSLLSLISCVQLERLDNHDSTNLTTPKSENNDVPETTYWLSAPTITDAETITFYDLEDPFSKLGGAPDCENEIQNALRIYLVTFYNEATLTVASYQTVQESICFLEETEPQQYLFDEATGITLLLEGQEYDQSGTISELDEGTYLFEKYSP